MKGQCAEIKATQTQGGHDAAMQTERERERERERGDGEDVEDGEDGEDGEERDREGRKERERGSRRKGRGQCRRTGPEALKFSQKVFMQ